jgi:hypothetical protein
MYDISHPFVSNWRVIKDCTMRPSIPKPSSVVASVYSEQDQGFCSRERRRPWPSTMLSGVMSFAMKFIVVRSCLVRGVGAAVAEV